MGCLLTLILSSAEGHTADINYKLNISTGEFPPYVSEQVRNQGPYTEIVKRAFQINGIETLVRFLPWKRAYKSALELKFDATYAWTPKPERKEKFLISDPVYTLERRAFVMRKSSIVASELEELGGLRVCRPNGYTLIGQIEEMVKRNELVRVSPPNMETCFKFLKENRVDFVDAVYEEGLTSISTALGHIESVRILDVSFSKNTNNLMVSKKHPRAAEIIQDFNSGLQSLIDSGEYSKIVERHRSWFLQSLLK